MRPWVFTHPHLPISRTTELMQSTEKLTNTKFIYILSWICQQKRYHMICSWERCCVRIELPVLCSGTGEELTAEPSTHRRAAFMSSFSITLSASLSLFTSSLFGQAQVCASVSNSNWCTQLTNLCAWDNWWTRLTNWFAHLTNCCVWDTNWWAQLTNWWAWLTNEKVFYFTFNVPLGAQ